MSMARRLAKCRSACLRCAGQYSPPRAARDGLVGKPDDRRAALRAADRHPECPRARGALLREHAHDFRDHVARAPDDHRVADHHVLAPDLVLVVQRGIGDGHAADEHRLEASHRRDGAGAPDLHVDADDFGRHLLGRELVGDGPAWLAGHESERVLQRERIDLVHDAVDLEGKAHPPGGNRLVEIGQLGRAMRNPPICIHRNAQGFERIEQRALGLGPRKVARFADSVGEEMQRTLRRHRRVDLPHGARGGIARVDEELASERLLPRIQLGEVAPRHVDLAAHLEHGGRMPTAQPVRYGPDRPDVRRDVLADLAVAAGRRHGEATVLVADAYRQPVELQLGHVLDRRRPVGKSQVAAHTGIELRCRTCGGVGLRADREHRHDMPHRGEIGPGCAADALRRRVRRHETGILRLERLQLPEQRVVLGVGDGRRVQHVIAAIVLGDLPPERRGPCDSGRRRGAPDIAGRRGGHDRLSRRRNGDGFSHRTGPARADCPDRCAPRASQPQSCAPARGWR